MGGLALMNINLMQAVKVRLHCVFVCVVCARACLCVCVCCVVALFLGQGPSSVTIIHCCNQASPFSSHPLSFVLLHAALFRCGAGGRAGRGLPFLGCVFECVCVCLLCVCVCVRVRPSHYVHDALSYPLCKHRKPNFCACLCSQGRS